MSATNKWILTVPREIHLGFIKETFGRGAIIELDMERGLLIIDGRKFDDTRDLELLQRRAIKHPNDPWVIPYSEEAYAQVTGAPSQSQALQPPPKKSREGLPIVQDDSTDRPPIDIRHTQVSRQHQAEKEAARTAAHEREVGREMEIVRGDESAEERIARLKGKSDMQSLTERVQLKRQRAKMAVVHDDSLGMGIGKSEIPLNAGQHLPSREEAEAKAEEQRQMAELRKQQLDMTRKRAGIELPQPGAVAQVDQDIPPELAEATEVVGGTTAEEIVGATEQVVTGTTVSDEDVAALEADFEAEAAAQESKQTTEPEGTEQSGREAELAEENAQLKEQNATLLATQEAILKRLEALESKPKTTRKPRKSTVKKTKTATKVKRTPVAATAGTED